MIGPPMDGRWPAGTTTATKNEGEAYRLQLTVSKKNKISYN
jgi:hypothetical protein